MVGYYRACHAIIVVYGITDDHSFRTLRYWNEAIEESASQSVVKILVGNKTDLSPQRVRFRLRQTFDENSR